MKLVDCGACRAFSHLHRATLVERTVEGLLVACGGIGDIRGKVL